MELIPLESLHAYLLSWHQAGRFDGAAAVVRRGELLLREGYGTPPDTRFQVGSITKSFIAAAVLKLVDQGLLALDSRIPEYRHNVTVHQLLSHTSGVPDHTTFPEYHTAAQVTPETIVERLNQRDLLFPPGQALVYSNSNYVLLARAIEAATNRPVSEYLQNELLAPAGLTDTSFPMSGLIQGGFSCSGEGVVPAEPYDLSGAFGSGNMTSMIDDLVKWVRLVASDRRMQTPHGRIPHMQGYNCQVTYLTAEDVTIVLLSNNDTTPLHRIEAGLRETLSGRPTGPVKPTPIPHADVTGAITGTYRCPYTGGSFTITNEKDRFYTDRLFAQTYRQQRFGLEPIATNRFAVAVCDGAFHFWPAEGRALYTWDTFQLPYTKEA